MNIYKKLKQYRAKLAMRRLNRGLIEYFKNAKPIGDTIGLRVSDDGIVLEIELTHESVRLKPLSEHHHKNYLT